WLIGTIIGLLSTAVLNLNNMRDLQSDAKVGKVTLAVKMGELKSKKYHSILILAALVLTFLYIGITSNYLNLFMLLGFIPLIIHIRVAGRNKVPRNLDPELKKVALSTVFVALIYLIT